MTPINWSWVGKSVEHYIDNEFAYIEAPWIVSRQAMNVTLPYNRSGFGVSHPSFNLGFLAGSAEQGFIQLMLDGKLPTGKYCAAGPCFRDENVDKWHLYTFFKVELIEVNPLSKNVFEIMDCARAFMECLTNCNIKVEKTQDGFDLTCKGIELGSYGYRTYDKYSWTYGTGLALPRFTQMLEFKEEII